MILKAIIEDQEYSLNVPDNVLTEAEDLFARLDADMNGGWQMSREWVNNPDRVQRCQIVADKMLTALEKENDKLGMLMAGYILTRMPGVESVEPDTHGEIQNTQFTVLEQPAAPCPSPRAHGDPATGCLGPRMPEQAGGNGASGERRYQGVQGGQGLAFLGFRPCRRSMAGLPLGRDRAGGRTHAAESVQGALRGTAAGQALSSRNNTQITARAQRRRFAKISRRALRLGANNLPLASY